MDASERVDVLRRISELQENTASVTVEIGGIKESSGTVEHDTLYIKDAPPAVIDELVDDYHLAVTDDGVQVY